MAYSKSKNAELIFRIKFFILSISAGAGLGGTLGAGLAKLFINRDFNQIFFMEFLLKKWVKDQHYFISLHQNYGDRNIQIMHQFADQFQQLILAGASTGGAFAAIFCIYLFSDFDNKKGY